MRLAIATFKLTRPDTSFLTLLSVLLPLYTRTQNFAASLKQAVPLLFVSMCTFIINDLDDIEKDKINHPTRPLPSGEVKPAFAASLYYACLALALLTTRTYITNHRAAFLYYLLLTLSISYHPIVEFLPTLKPAYVALAVSIPVLILAGYYPHDITLYRVAASVSVFTLGRELCMDLCDRPGDPLSLFHRFPEYQVATVGFALQGAGMVLVGWGTASPIDATVMLGMLALFLLSHHFWFELRRPKPALAFMKAIMFLGLYFLL